jgi:DNA-binding NarL/FixJ family response regulator
MTKHNYPLIFVVEDNKAYSKAIQHFLKVNNFGNIQSFSSGEECLRNLRQKPDIIIQDYNLEGISGLNVLTRTKKFLPNTEFIFLSSKQNPEIVENAIQQGAFAYILKNDAAFIEMIEKIESIGQKQRSRAQRKQRLIVILLIIVAVAGLLLLLTKI